jgi:hypothetical protein
MSCSGSSEVSLLDAPQWPQKRIPSGFSPPQLAHTQVAIPEL